LDHFSAESGDLDWGREMYIIEERKGEKRKHWQEERIAYRSATFEKI